MIILKKLQINNFLSHEKTTIEFESNSEFLIDGRSGSGKSTIPEAIIWALYGKGRSDNRNLVKRGKKVAKVILDLSDDSDDKVVQYRIERSISDKGKHVLSLEESNDGIKYTPLQITGLKEIQDFIETKIVRASYSLFINSVAYPQDNIESFVRQPANKRKDLLLEVISAEDYDLYYGRARDQLSLEGERRVRAVTQIESLEHQIKETEPLVKDIQQKKEQEILLQKTLQEVDSSLLIVKAKEEEVNSIERGLAAETSALKTFQYQQRTYSDQIDTIKAKIETIKSLDLNNVDHQLLGLIGYQDELKELEETQEKIYQQKLKRSSLMSDFRVNNYDYDSEIREINKQLIKLMTDGGIEETCPVCNHSYKSTKSISSQMGFLEGQIKQKNELKLEQERQKKVYEEALSALGPEVTLAEGALERYNTLKGLVKNIPNLESQKAMILSQREQLPTYEGELSSLMTNCAEVNVSASDCQSTIIALEAKLNEYRGSYDVLKEKNLIEQKEKLTSQLAILQGEVAVAVQAQNTIEICQKSIATKRQELLEVTEKVEVLSLIKEAFSPKGVKTVVVDYLIPRLEEKINEILGELSDFRIRLETQRQANNGETMLEGLFINIYNEVGEEFDFDNYSGGQKLKITVAIAEALATLQKVGFRIFDELFIGLDEESTEDFSNVLEKLRRNFRQTICISHLRSIKDLFDHKIIVTKINGTSTTENG
jgi:exonuclease SbcC